MFQTWHPYPPNSSMTAVLNSSNHTWGSVWKLGNFLGVYRYTDSPLSDTAIHMVSSLSPLKITKSSPPKPGFPQQFLRDLVEERPWPTAEETIAVFPSIWGANFGLPQKNHGEIHVKIKNSKDFLSTHHGIGWNRQMLIISCETSPWLPHRNRSCAILCATSTAPVMGVSKKWGMPGYMAM